MTLSVLVTGAAGFIGSHLCEALLARGHAVVGIDNLSMGQFENLLECTKTQQFRFSKVDVLDIESLSKVARGVDVIAHLAAFKIPRYGNAHTTLEVNGVGGANVLKVAFEQRAKVVIASTSDVYGKSESLPFAEDGDSVVGSSRIPRWSYAVSKMFVEHLAFAAQEQFGTPVSIARLFGTYGPGHHLSWWGGPQSVFISALLRGKDIEIHGDGLQTRSFCYVSDLVDGLVAMIERHEANGEIINLGSDEQVISIADLARLIHMLVDDSRELRLRFIPYETFGHYEDVRNRVPDLSKARMLLGYCPKVSLIDGLRRTISWQRLALK